LGSVGSPTLVIMRVEQVPSLISKNGDAVRGKALYLSVCATCHGESGQGIPGHPLTHPKSRLDFEATVARIKQPKAPMPKLYPGQLADHDVADLAAYLQDGISAHE
jgi:mono/diheme cytochrome c family protein